MKYEISNWTFLLTLPSPHGSSFARRRLRASYTGTQRQAHAPPLLHNQLPCSAMAMMGSGQGNCKHPRRPKRFSQSRNCWWEQYDTIGMLMSGSPSCLSEIVRQGKAWSLPRLLSLSVSLSACLDVSLVGCIKYTRNDDGDDDDDDDDDDG